jgi:hypothetical protein
MDQFIFFLPLILIFIFIFIFAVLFPTRYKKLNANLVAYFKGHGNYFGDVVFTYSSIKFRVSRISRGGGGDSNYGGAYLQLCTYVSNSERIIIGHAQSGKYAIGKFLFLPPSETVDLGLLRVLIGADQPTTLAKIKAHLADKKFINACSILFNQEFNSLIISSEMHISKFLPKKKYVLRYSPLPNRIYTNPEELKCYLEAIADICSLFNLQNSIE